MPPEKPLAERIRDAALALPKGHRYELDVVIDVGGTPMVVTIWVVGVKPASP